MLRPLLEKWHRSIYWSLLFDKKVAWNLLDLLISISWIWIRVQNWPKNLTCYHYRTLRQPSTKHNETPPPTKNTISPPLPTVAIMRFCCSSAQKALMSGRSDETNLKRCNSARIIVPMQSDLGRSIWKGRENPAAILDAGRVRVERWDR